MHEGRVFAGHYSMLKCTYNKVYNTHNSIASRITHVMSIEYFSYLSYNHGCHLVYTGDSLSEKVCYDQMADWSTSRLELALSRA